MIPAPVVAEALIRGEVDDFARTFCNFHIVVPSLQNRSRLSQAQQ